MPTLRHTFAASVLLLGLQTFQTERPIDRRALVTRHEPVLKHFDPESPLIRRQRRVRVHRRRHRPADFPETYDETIPLGTLFALGLAHVAEPGTAGRSKSSVSAVRHPRPAGRLRGHSGRRRTPEIAWLRANPHRLHLGQIGFRLTRRDGQPAAPRDLTEIHQTLELWDGVLVSRFTLDGEPVEVETVCHPPRDLIAVRVASPLVARAGSRSSSSSPTAPAQSRPPIGTSGAHQTTVLNRPAPNARRTSPDDSTTTRYRVEPLDAASDADGSRSARIPAHARARLDQRWSSVATFTPDDRVELAIQSFDAARSPREHWNNFWTTGGAIDLSGSRIRAGGARTPHRPLAVSHRDPVRRRLSAARDRPHLQQLGRQVPPRDALVARGPLRPLEPLPLFERSLDYYHDPARARQTAHAKATPGPAGRR